MGSNKNDRLKKQYIGQIEMFLPAKTKKEKQYLHKMEEAINDALLDNGIDNFKTIEDYYMAFGEPYEIVHKYLSEMDNATFQKVIHNKKIKKNTYCIAVGLVFCAFLYICFFLWKDYRECQDSEIASFTTEIEILEEIIEEDEIR